MKSKKSFNISFLLIAQDLKRFWLLPAMTGLIYLLFSTALFNSVISSAFSGHNVLNLLQQTAVPISASICCFAYLHSRDSAVLAHAMPFNRKKIFFSHALSGWILSMIPVVICALLFLPPFSGSFHPELSHIEQIKEILIWTLKTAVGTTFVYSVSVLASVVAGTVVTHLLLAMFFNGVVPVVVFLTNRYMNIFLFGMCDFPIASSVLSPVSLPEHIYSYNFALYFTVYLIVSVVLIWLSSFLYQRIPLEREGNSVIFKPIGELICYIFAFIGMSLFTFYFAYRFLNTSWGLSVPCGIAGGAFGAVLFYIIGRMILEKSIRVFTVKNLKRLTVFAVMATVFLAFTVFDITGFTSRVPEPADVESVYVSALEVKTELTDSEDIACTTEFHRNITEYAKPADNIAESTATVELRYKLKNGKTMSRRYYLNPEQNREMQGAIEEYYHSSAYQKHTDAYIASTRKFFLASLEQDGNEFQPPAEYNLDSRIYDELREALIKDQQERSFEQELMRSHQFSAYMLNLYFEDDDMESIKVMPYDKHTIEVLAECGYELNLFAVE